MLLDDTKEKQALEILSNLAFESYQSRDYIKAIVYYNKYLEINSQNPEIYNMLGYIYRKIGCKYQNLDKQIECFEKAIELNPDYYLALRNLAITYPLLGRYKEAIACFQKLFELEPVVDDYLAYAYLQIQTGNFEEGWKYYEHRFFRKYGPTEYPKIDYKPKWDGSKIQDKILLVHYEQGYGDSIQFFRYLEQVKPLVKKIIFRVQDELVDLLKNCSKDIEICGISTPLEELQFDYHISLMSLLHVLNASIDSIPLSKGYIKADSALVEEYKKKFFDNDYLKIGITWNGRKFGNKNRDIPLKYFYPLAKLKNVQLYAFQKGFGIEQLEKLHPNIEIIDVGKTFKNFSDTAAALENLDLFITSDNCVFNLAGAMGKKTFLLLNKYSEWRWFLDEETTPWYDSVKIFKKQDEDDSWGLLINKIIENLIEK